MPSSSVSTNLDGFYVFLSEQGGGAADRTEVEAAVLLAGVGYGLGAVSFGEYSSGLSATSFISAYRSGGDAPGHASIAWKAALWVRASDFGGAAMRVQDIDFEMNAVS